MGVQLLETDFAGPLNPDTVGLLIGRSSTTLRGLRVHPGIIDPDLWDSERFAFTLPSINHEEPDRRYQWVVLPQARQESALHQAYIDLIECLKDKGLEIAPEKVQQGHMISFLGSKVTSQTIHPQKDRKDPIWVPERLMRKVQPQLPDDEVDITAAAAAATPSPAESHGATLGDSVCIPEADADIA
ncbi:hypothetical protein STEG23_027568 [Scotinomys teguina]